MDHKGSRSGITLARKWQSSGNTAEADLCDRVQLSGAWLYSSSNRRRLRASEQERKFETIRVSGDQREPSSPRFEPRPLFLLGRGSTRGIPNAARSSRRDASTRRGGCSASAVTTRVRNILPAK